MRASLTRLSRPLVDRFASAAGTRTDRELLLLRVEDEAGVPGYGEAAPLRADADQVEAALRDCLPVLERGSGDHAELLAGCARLAVLPEAVAAVDLALWDLAGRRAGAPVWKLLGAPEPLRLSVNATIAAPDRATAAAQAARARERGFRAVKVKVGLGDDAGRLASIRAAAGPEMSIRLDANGAWTVAEARAALAALEPVGLELCEEPVRGLDATAELAAGCTVPVAIDETVADPGALARRVCQAACLKVAACGGITGLLESWRAARASGYDVYLASSLDGPLGISAALHAAPAISPERPCGLATLEWFADPTEALMPRDGRLGPPPGPGLGGDLIDWYS